ncbi:anti-sigma factor family protein [Streptomyces lunaelactis]|uniref:anti-sigma factor family protein n=1 Tax=Streptomyces lunaelactis TaxID=1535768 RepID=UPI001584CB01|nr:zf-HC2 domain-containing protein [Streptomyces lunaelactis]NUK04920.1 zf-HC2 domain-containing protein [Streptomyces lunaelactis]NUK19314.1 zf-HC2 domain-containing protein [Streptomyces lunaelactis]
MTMYEQESVHDAVGAYVLGILDDADASAFEAHLAGCDYCATHLEEFSGMEPMLAMLAEAPSPVQQPNVLNMRGLHAMPGAGFPQQRPVPVVPTAPSPQLLGGLLDEVAAKRAAKRRRGMYMVAAAAALIIGGPAVAVVATSDDTKNPQAGAEPHPTSPAEDAFFNHMDEKVRATDATTKVSATVGLEKKGWGTHTVLELKNVKGPLKCNLIAVSKTGEEEVVTSWAVPKWGYGIPDSPVTAAKNPLYVHGGAAMDRNDIDHFEVRTFEGKRLVEVEA